MPPVASGSNLFIKDEVARFAQEWFDIVAYEVASAPRNLSAEELWSRHSQLLDHGMRLYKQLFHIAHRPESYSASSTGRYLERTTGTLLSETTAQEMLKGVVDFVRAARYSSFSERCLEMPSPSMHAASSRRLHEVLFESSDCFIELSRIRPANHGWLFVFREELQKWLLSAINPFHVIYRDSNGKRTVYGVYRALAFPEGSMSGPEFAQLSEFTREIIATHISRSSKGTRLYNAAHRSLIASHQTLRCIIFQCTEAPPGDGASLSTRISAAHLNGSSRNCQPASRSRWPVRSDFPPQVARAAATPKRPRTPNAAAQSHHHYGRGTTSHAPPATFAESHGRFMPTSDTSTPAKSLPHRF